MQCSDLLLYCVAPYNLFVSLSAGVCVSTLPHVYQLLVSRAFSVCVVCSCLNQAALGCMGSSPLHRCSTIRPAVLPVLHAWRCCLCGWVLPAWMSGQCLRRPPPVPVLVAYCLYPKCWPLPSTPSTVLPGYLGSSLCACGDLSCL